VVLDTEVPFFVGHPCFYLFIDHLWNSPQNRGLVNGFARGVDVIWKSGNMCQLSSLPDSHMRNKKYAPYMTNSETTRIWFSFFLVNYNNRTSIISNLVVAVPVLFLFKF
jgi:hypothetical protein